MSDVAPILRRPVETAPGNNYPLLAVRSFGRGTFCKPPLEGDEITWQNLFQVRAGDLLFSNIKAWEGAVAIVANDDDGRYCSHRYITCAADQAQVLPAFLGYYFRTPQAVWQLAQASPGSADRNRTLSMAALKRILVPLPSLEEQGRIVAQLNTVVAKLHQIDAIHGEIDRTIAALEKKALVDEIARYRGRPHRRLSEVVVVTGGGTPSRHNPTYWDGDIPWVTPKDMKQDVISDSQEHISAEGIQNSPAKLVNASSVLIVVRGMILARTVPVALITRSVAINQDMKALTPLPGLRSDYLWTWLLCCGEELLSRVGKSTHDTRKLESAALLSLPIYIPEEGQQQEFVARVCRIRAQIGEFKRTKIVALTEQSHVLPAMLLEIFGEGEA
ncbi:MAG: restriction endonuclease subunit S [Alphaproteobacteria bacterium]|nr:restriction endonuclease subunit S [Alphaproteobacteria bacterium]